jgi:TrmH family RNA methyltransferase
VNGVRKLVSSRDNPLVKSLLKLAASSRERRRCATTLLDGVHLIEAYRDARLGAVEVLAATECAMQRPEVKALLESTPARAKAILAEPLLKHVSQVVSSAGVLAAVRTPDPGPLPERVDDGIFLEQVQDPGNLGSVLRSALAAGIGRLFLSPGCVLAWSPKVVRAGMGAHFRLRIHENVDIGELAARARGALIATEPEAARTLYESDLRGPVVWLFGNEAAGLSERAAGAAQTRLRIPMPGPAESLNLAACVAVCLFEQVRQRSAGASRPCAPGETPGPR